MDDSACSGHALGEACEELTVRLNQLGGLKRRFAMKRKRAVGKGVAGGSEEEGEERRLHSSAANCYGKQASGGKGISRLQRLL